MIYAAIILAILSAGIVAGAQRKTAELGDRASAIHPQLVGVYPPGYGMGEPYESVTPRIDFERLSAEKASLEARARVWSWICTMFTIAVAFFSGAAAGTAMSVILFVVGCLFGAISIVPLLVNKTGSG